MKKTILAIFTGFLLAFSVSGYSAESGNDLLLMGDSTAAIGRGGAGVTSFGVDLFPFNPASIGWAEQFELGVQYGSLGLNYYSPSVSLAIPTSYGIIGGNFKMVKIADNPSDLSTGYQFSLGAAKDFSRNLSIGLALNFLYGSSVINNENVLFPGLTLGAIYKFNYNKEFKKGFGFYSPRIGFSICAGIPIGNTLSSNLNQATIGYQFGFFKLPKAEISFFNEVSAINGYGDFPVKIGLESLLWNHYIIRTGGVILDSYDYGDFDFGLGYKFKIKNLDGDINYTLAHKDGKDFNHYVGLNLKYGELDRTAPVTVIKSTEQYISPNHDGTQDYVVFNTEVSDKSIIKGWNLKVVNSENKVVREFKVSDREMDSNLTFKGFFKKIWQKKESMVVPPSILWDGTDGNGQVLPDGLYSYKFIAWDERENYSSPKEGAVIIDNNAPVITANIGDTLFSPNSDKQKDELLVKQTVVAQNEDQWQGGFRNSTGQVVKTYSWKGKEVPAEIRWDGKDDNGNDVPEGQYTYFVETRDSAGNAAKFEAKEIGLTRQYEVVDIKPSLKYYSYTTSKEKEINFFAEISKTDGLVSWKVSVKNESGDVVRDIVGNKEIPKVISWDCRDMAGKNLPDGKYSAIISTNFTNGNTPTSFGKEIIFDSTAPRTELQFVPDLFSPDEDGENDILTLSPKAEDTNEIVEWTINIYNPANILFKTFTGKGAPAESIKWDGIGKDNELVESASDYTIEFIAKDVAGNISKIGDIKLPIDVLVMVTERGLKIRISNIEFAFGSAELLKKSRPVLNRVADKLGKYSSYNIIVEGHTDDIGKDEFNLELSEKRAKAVQDYLITRGVDKNRLTIRGMGETKPYLPNLNDENRRKNRRVEFFLIKDRAAFEAEIKASQEKSAQQVTPAGNDVQNGQKPAGK